MSDECRELFCSTFTDTGLPATIYYEDDSGVEYDVCRFTKDELDPDEYRHYAKIFLAADALIKFQNWCDEWPKTGAWHPCTELPKCYAGDRVVVYIDDEKRSHTDTKPTPELFILEATEGGWAAVDNTYGGYEPSWGRAWAYERDLFPSATTLAELAKEIGP